MNAVSAATSRTGFWKSAPDKFGEAGIVVQPIGDDPDALRSLNPDLDIWDAYETVHVLMPDGSMKLGGEAVAEVLRCLPNAKWFARCFAIGIFGFGDSRRYSTWPTPSWQTCDHSSAARVAARPAPG